MADPIFSATIANIPFNQTTQNGQQLSSLLRSTRQLADGLTTYVAIQSDKIDGGAPGSGTAANFQRMVDLQEYTTVEFAQASYNEMNGLKIQVDTILATLQQAATKHGF